MRLKEEEGKHQNHKGKEKPSFLGNAKDLLSRYLDKSFLRKKRKRKRKTTHKKNPRKLFSCVWLSVGALTVVAGSERACVRESGERLNRGHLALTTPSQPKFLLLRLPLYRLRWILAVVRVSLSNLRQTRNAYRELGAPEWGSPSLPRLHTDAPQPPLGAGTESVGCPARCAPGHQFPVLGPVAQKWGPSRERSGR